MEAFQALGDLGKLVLNPSAIGLGSASELTGAALVRHPQLWQLLEPPKDQTEEQKAQAALNRLSAKEFRELNPEEFRQETPALIEQKFQQATQTFLSFNSEYVVTNKNRQHIESYIEKRRLAYNIQSLETV